MSIQTIKEDEFKNEILKSPIPVLIDFWAEWCGPCKEIALILEEIVDEMKDKIKIVNPNIPYEYGIQSIPTLIIFKKGKPIATKVGVVIKSELKTWIETSI